jgi:hypothetical protein
MSTANLLRTFSNFCIYSLMSIFVFMAAFDMPVMYYILSGAGWMGGILYALRTWAALLFVFIGLFADDMDYYTYITNFDSEVSNYFAESSTDFIGGKFMQQLDFQIEAGNLVLGALGGHFFSKGMKVWKPLYDSGISSIPHHAKKHMAADTKKADEPEDEPAATEDGDDEGDF